MEHIGEQKIDEHKQHFTSVKCRLFFYPEPEFKLGPALLTLELQDIEVDERHVLEHVFLNCALLGAQRALEHDPTY